MGLLTKKAVSMGKQHLS